MHAEVDGDGKFRISSSGKEAVQAQAQILLADIKSKTMQKLGLYVLAAVFLVGAALLVVFAPDGRQVVSSIIAFGLVAVAAGSAGYARFSVKVPGASIDAGDLIVAPVKDKAESVSATHRGGDVAVPK